MRVERVSEQDKKKKRILREYIDVFVRVVYFS
jgi:hypothetical protein